VIAIFIITAFIIILYLVYPLWLTFITSDKSVSVKETEEINCVSVILLSYNGINYLEEKINFLIREISGFKCYELIVIDDDSTDGSAEILNKFRSNEHVKVLYNSKQEGIPFCMNLGVANANYDNVIFCDQRQVLSEGSLKKIVEPLKYANVGAVSGCISILDKGKKCSYLRKHENFLKIKESKTGSLIGVYGPFYAIKKQCYSLIPEHIILDDLYLSLKILKSGQIELSQECQITDDDFSSLYDYKRTKRYLSGLLQLLKEKSLIGDLNYRQMTMLFWHKYLRLIIPSLLFLCYISLGIGLANGIEFIITFCVGTAIALLSILPGRFMCRFRLKNLVRMNVFYFIAFLDILINDAFKQHTL
jgi:poly-beta-1,6-N-acetyl-D-glucosamine synthase